MNLRWVERLGFHGSARLTKCAYKRWQDQRLISVVGSGLQGNNNTPWDLLIDCSNTWFRDSVLAHIGPFMTVRKIHSELKMLLPRKDSVHL